MTHVVLLGDSIFDNGAYVPGRPDVVRQLRARLPDGASATLLAIDGDVTAGVPRQLARLPAGATHLVVSVGGNDALRNMGVFGEPSRTVGAALGRLAELTGAFQEAYRGMLDALLAPGLPAAVCTIYDPRFPDAPMQRLAVAGLRLFNDAILREAAARGLPVLDLRLICDEDRDYANPIEPSAHGGEKIAGAIARLVAEHDFGARRSVLVTR